MDKVLTREELLSRRAVARAAGLRVVHCHGCFDLLHPGHIRHLSEARALGDILVVSITADAQVRKGAGRPRIGETLRAETLAALGCVDWVYIEARPTAADLLGEVRPDVYVKGREYESNGDPRFRAEQAVVERHGGRVSFTSGDVVFSSTALIGMLERPRTQDTGLGALLERDELSAPALASVVRGFRGTRVVIVGDAILDTYVLCDPARAAGECTAPTLLPRERRHYDGGAAIIARHIAAMGGEPVLVTALGRDERAEAMRRRLEAEGVHVRTVARDGTPCEKQRFLVGTQKVMRLDLGGGGPATPDPEHEERLIALAADAAEERGGCDAAIIADFGEGLLTADSVERLSGVLRARAGVTAGSVKGPRSSLRRMRGMDLLCPSEPEARGSLGMADEPLRAVARRLLDETGSRATLLTMGADGLTAFDRAGLNGERAPALCRAPVDALGCGDALLAAATLALAGGASLLAGALIGSLAAAVEAMRLGNIPVSAGDVRRRLARVVGERGRTSRRQRVPELRDGVPGSMVVCHA